MLVQLFSALPEVADVVVGHCCCFLVGLEEEEEEQGGSEVNVVQYHWIGSASALAPQQLSSWRSNV